MERRAVGDLFRNGPGERVAVELQDDEAAGITEIPGDFSTWAHPEHGAPGESSCHEVRVWEGSWRPDLKTMRPAMSSLSGAEAGSAIDGKFSCREKNARRKIRVWRGGKSHC